MMRNTKQRMWDITSGMTLHVRCGCHLCARRWLSLMVRSFCHTLQASQGTFKTFKSLYFGWGAFRTFKVPFGPLSAFIFTLEPLFPTFCKKKCSLYWFRTEF